MSLLASQRVAFFHSFPFKSLLELSESQINLFSPKLILGDDISQQHNDTRLTHLLIAMHSNSLHIIIFSILFIRVWKRQTWIHIYLYICMLYGLRWITVYGVRDNNFFTYNTKVLVAIV